MSAAEIAVAPPAEPPGKRFFALDLLDNRYPALHGLRVIAIVSVVQYHVSWILNFSERGMRLDPEIWEASRRVWFGMDLFFILSGFLIGSILLRSLKLSGTQNIRRFYLRRVFRTFPSYYVVLTVLALAFPLTNDQRRHLVWEYLYGTNFLPMPRTSVVMTWGWSLALEEQFYLVVPLLFYGLYRLRSDRARLGLLVALWASALLVRLGIYVHGRPWLDVTLQPVLYFQTYTRFDSLVLGIILAFVHDQHGDAIGAWLEAPVHRALLSMVAAACLWVLLRPDMFGVDTVPLMHVFAWGTITSLMYFPMLLLVLHGDGWIHRLLAAPVFRKAATLGYGVYLVHIPILDHVIGPWTQVLAARGMPQGVLWVGSLTVALAISFAIGYAMHVLIEKPSLRIRERFAA